jgi:hypothetical protein
MSTPTPADLDTSPIVVIGLVQSKRLEAILSDAEPSKERLKLLADTASTALGQLRIQTDSETAKADQQIKEALIDVIKTNQKNPFITNTITDVNPVPPTLQKSILPGEVIEAAALTVGIGSPTIEDVIGAEAVARMAEESIGGLDDDAED